MPCILQHRYVAFLRHEARKITKTLYLCSTLKKRRPWTYLAAYSISFAFLLALLLAALHSGRIISFNYSSIFSSLQFAHGSVDINFHCSKESLSTFIIVWKESRSLACFCTCVICSLFLIDNDEGKNLCRASKLLPITFFSLDFKGKFINKVATHYKCKNKFLSKLN